MLTNEEKKSILNDRIKESEGVLLSDPNNTDLVLKINALKELDSTIPGLYESNN